MNVSLFSVSLEVPGFRLPFPIRAILLLAIPLALTVPMVYKSIPLLERFMFLPWLVFSSAYGILLAYENVNSLNKVTKGELVSVGNNYPYVLYWILLPLVLHYIPVLLSHVTVPHEARLLVDSEEYERIVAIAGWPNFFASTKTTDYGFLYFLFGLFCFSWAMLGVWKAVRARVYLNGCWGIDLYAAKDDSSEYELVKTGPYSRCMHPIYGGQMHLAWATALAFQAWPFAVFALLVCWQNYMRASTEEAHLENLFGDTYSTYKNETNRRFGWLY